MSTASLLITDPEQFYPRQSKAATLDLIEDDELLELLSQAANEELDGIVRCLVEKGGWTCQLKRTQAYKNFHPHHRAYTRDIAAELQKYGGNTVVNRVARSGRGVPYRKIVDDVAKHLGVKPCLGTRETEIKIREHLFAEMWRRMSVAERETFVGEYGRFDAALATKSVLPALVLKSLSASGFAAYKASVILANAFSKAVVGHGLSFITNSLITKSVSVLLGPVGWSVAATYAASAVSGEAYRVTVPCVLQISMIREANAMRENQRVRESGKMKRLLLGVTLGLFIVSIGILWFVLRSH